MSSPQFPPVPRIFFPGVVPLGLYRSVGLAGLVLEKRYDIILAGWIKV